MIISGCILPLRGKWIICETGCFRHYVPLGQVQIETSDFFIDKS